LTGHPPSNCSTLQCKECEERGHTSRNCPYIFRRHYDMS
jgi:hypothetical protein